MINVVHARASITTTAGEDMVIAKAQFAYMLDEIELGNAARMQLINVRSIVNSGVRRTGLAS